MDAVSASLPPLRFITCGSVDDGKSTLIGRLLHESRLILDDHLTALTKASARHGTTGDEIDLALLTDGLEAEREQGITIDVAYRSFATEARSFGVADTPGHAQYTRNMATGASTADLAIILVDASRGLQPQTRRHSAICSLLGIRHVILAINKIDLPDDAEAVFHRIARDYADFAASFGFTSATAIPISARFGDNVTRRSERTPWYDGPTLLHLLETIDVSQDHSAVPFRFPVQRVVRPDADFRGFAGSVATGAISVGDEVVVASSGRHSNIARIVTFDGDLPVTSAGQAVTLVLSDDIDIARGDLLSAPQTRPELADQFAARLVWMDEAPMLPGRSYLLRLGTDLVPARITSLRHRIDINDLSEQPARTLGMNDIGVVHVAADRAVAFDPYTISRHTGAFILIDRATNATAGAGMIDFALRRATNIHRQMHQVGQAERAASLGQTACVLWFTGLSGSGKSTIADLVEQELHRMGRHTMQLDGDNLRFGLNRDLGFTDADRVENIRRTGEVAKLMVEAGLIVICCFISPFAQERQGVRARLGEGEFIEIFVDTPLEDCIRRDPKGLYTKALAGQIPNFTGIGSPYEPPGSAELHLDGTQPAEESAARVIDLLRLRG
jgi:bifunctional enzyme CysN/CysC